MQIARAGNRKSRAKDVTFKLNRASAILGIRKKDLQNLVQFGVIRPRRRGGLYLFDVPSLYEAEIATTLKIALGMSTPRLSEFIRAFSRSVKRNRSDRSILVFRTGSSWKGATLEVGLHLAKVDLRIKRALKSVLDAADQRRVREYHAAKAGAAKVTACFLKRGKDVKNVKGCRWSQLGSGRL
jgi:hypothetical protein